MRNYPAIRGVVNSYRGKTYWFFDNNMFSEIDDCRFLPKSTALITEQFTGVPSKIDSVFRYTNGIIYFLYNGHYYGYDEFSNSLKVTGKLSLDFFGISCPNISILEKLKVLLNKIITQNIV